MNIITATNYNGRLHLGIGDDQNAPKAMGSINVYRNPIAKFFTKFFSYSIDVEIDGKTRTLNVNSLNNHLSSIGLNFSNNQSVQEIKKIGYDVFINNNAHQIKHSGKILGDDFSEDKKIKLLEKLISKIQVNNVEAAKKIVRKGAPLEREVFLVKNYQKQTILHRRAAVELHLKESRSQSIDSFTPLSLAVFKGNKIITDYISNFKQNNLSNDRFQIIKYEKENFYSEDYDYTDIHGYPTRSILDYTQITIGTKEVNQVVRENDELILKDVTKESHKTKADFMWNAQYKINERQ